MIPIPLGLKPTPFAGRSRPANQFDEVERWAGFATAHSYGNPEREYFAIRNTASLYDLSPMHKYRVTGPEALAFLQRLVTRDVSKIGPGRVGYVAWCDDDGKVLDDGTVFHVAPGDYRLCCQEPQLGHFTRAAAGFDVLLEDVSAKVAGLSLQGPTSCAVLRHAGFAGIETLKPFGLRGFPFRGGLVTISRTGFTGDLGYEIWIEDFGLAEPLWDALIAAGRDRAGVIPIGSHALNIARIEAGFLQAQTDFLPADQVLRPDRAKSPFELGLDWLVDFDKGHFNGRRALLKERAQGSRWCLVGLEIEGDKPAENSLVYHRKRKEVGQITSAIWSPTAKKNIALASLERPYGAEVVTDLWVELYLLRELKWERFMLRAKPVPRPFFDPPRRKATPPADF